MLSKNEFPDIIMKKPSANYVDLIKDEMYSPPLAKSSINFKKSSCQGSTYKNSLKVKKEDTSPDFPERSLIKRFTKTISTQVTQFKQRN